MGAQNVVPIPSLFNKGECKAKFTCTRILSRLAILLCGLTALINMAVAVWETCSPLMVLPQLRQFVPLLPGWATSALFDAAWFLAFALPAFLCILVYQFKKNAIVLHSLKPSIGPAMSVLAFLIPFVNFVLPARIVSELFAVNAPEKKSPTILLCWESAWITVLLTIGVYFFVTVLVFCWPGVSANSAYALECLLWIPIQLGFATFLIINMILVNQLQAAQDSAQRSITEKATV